MTCVVTGNYVGTKIRDYKGKTYYQIAIMQDMTPIIMDCTEDDYHLAKDNFEMFKPLVCNCNVYANCKDNRAWISTKLIKIINGATKNS